jgi:hypothetical protein
MTAEVAKREPWEQSNARKGEPGELRCLIQASRFPFQSFDNNNQPFLYNYYHRTNSNRH